MTTYYVRKTGNNSNAGTSAGAAWLTIGKALGATGIASGDTVYIGAGTYREVVTVNMTSAVAETFIIGDVDGVQTGDAGEVIWTAYTTNDTTAPANTALLTLSARDFLTFRRITMVEGNALLINGITSSSTNIKIQDCVLLGNPGTTNSMLFFAVGFGAPIHLLIERCWIRGSGGNVLALTLARGTGSDYDADVIVRNVVFYSVVNSNFVVLNSGGAGANEGGGGYIYNSLLFGPRDGDVIKANDANVTGATWTFPMLVYNCIIHGGLSAAESGQLVEDYNHILATTTHTNVTQGANTKTNLTYAQLLSIGEHSVVGSTPRLFGEPRVGSPYLGFGNDGTYTSAEDARGYPRPAGGVSATKGIGAYERSNTFAKETGTVRTGSNAISITGPGYQDFQLPVAASSTTVTVYVRWDATYAGTKPKMQVLNGTEAGVADATATATGSSGAWEQLALAFTPTSAGIVTIRLLSSDTNGGGKCFADDFAVS